MIKFYSNYKKSSTRYFIIIAPKTEYNSEEHFANPCYITNFIIEPNKNVKIETIFDIGENDIINAEVNISDIKEGNKYIVNIISQELRFDKKLNYYKPKIFEYKSDEPESEEEESKDDEKNEPSGKNETPINDNNNENKNGKLAAVYIILISLGGVIAISVIIIIIIICMRKKDYEKLTKQVNAISFINKEEDKSEEILS